MAELWTKGPWHVGGKVSVPIVYGPDGLAVANATVFHGTFKEGETDANAHLIAASPDLYDALAGMVEATRAVCVGLKIDFEQESKFEGSPTFKALAALAKAEGRS